MSLLKNKWFPRFHLGFISCLVNFSQGGHTGKSSALPTRSPRETHGWLCIQLQWVKVLYNIQICSFQLSGDDLASRKTQLFVWTFLCWRWDVNVMIWIYFWFNFCSTSLNFSNWFIFFKLGWNFSSAKFGHPILHRSFHRVLRLYLPFLFFF